jgi:hypothetical protein
MYGTAHLQNRLIERSAQVHSNLPFFIHNVDNASRPASRMGLHI